MNDWIGGVDDRECDCTIVVDYDRATNSLCGQSDPAPNFLRKGVGRSIHFHVPAVQRLRLVLRHQQAISFVHWVDERWWAGDNGSVNGDCHTWWNYEGVVVFVVVVVVVIVVVGRKMFLGFDDGWAAQTKTVDWNCRGLSILVRVLMMIYICR